MLTEYIRHNFNTPLACGRVIIYTPAAFDTCKKQGYEHTHHYQYQSSHSFLLQGGIKVDLSSGKDYMLASCLKVKVLHSFLSHFADPELFP